MTETPVAAQRRGGRVLTSAEIDHRNLDSLLVADAKKVKKLRMVPFEEWYPTHRDTDVPDQRFWTRLQLDFYVAFVERQPELTSRQITFQRQLELRTSEDYLSFFLDWLHYLRIIDTMIQRWSVSSMLHSSWTMTGSSYSSCSRAVTKGSIESSL